MMEELRIDEPTRQMIWQFEAMLQIHSKALACHCECLGMNAANSWAVCADRAPPYDEVSYDKVMQKWGLINEKGSPIL